MKKKAAVVDCQTITFMEFLREMGKAMGLSQQQIEEFIRDMEEVR
jgi:hypothetical protein